MVSVWSCDTCGFLLVLLWGWIRSLCEGFFFLPLFFNESHPPSHGSPPIPWVTLLEGNKSVLWVQWKRQLWEGLHSDSASHVSCYSPRELKFTANVCFNLLLHCSGISGKAAVHLPWKIGSLVWKVRARPGLCKCCVFAYKTEGIRALYLISTPAIKPTYLKKMYTKRE